MNPSPFENPVFVTAPLLPDLDQFKHSMESIWESGWLTNRGEQHQKLQAELQSVLKVKDLSLFCNGTMALLMACRALAVSGEVITTPFTFPATPHCISWAGARPVFCDINADDLTIDPDKLEALITPKTSAILGVHVFGNPCKVSKIEEIAKRHRLKVIYDAAHVFGVEVNGRGIGEFGDISMFSFHATKVFHTAEGGCLTFNDPSLKESIELMKNFGISSEECVEIMGLNGKMNEMQAALGLEVLKLVEEEIAVRRRLFEIYQEELKELDGVSILSPVPNIRANYGYCVILVDEDQAGLSRDTLHHELKNLNVMTRKYFYPLCCDYPHYRSEYSDSELPIARKIAGQVLCLPLHGRLRTEDVYRICNMMKTICREASSSGVH